MTTSYATVTSKGQITLPAHARRALGLVPGRKVAITIEGDHLVLESPVSLADVRTRLRAEAEAAGTWGQVPVAGDGWAAHVAEEDPA